MRMFEPKILRYCDVMFQMLIVLYVIVESIYVQLLIIIKIYLDVAQT